MVRSREGSGTDGVGVVKAVNGVGQKAFQGFRRRIRKRAEGKGSEGFCRYGINGVKAKLVRAGI